MRTILSFETSPLKRKVVKDSVENLKSVNVIGNKTLIRPASNFKLREKITYSISGM